ncbi:hypothetical protein KZX50_19940 [Bacillus infantis]|uniref:hypothetical protein n=1 Tax=Bacillus infantis TaxID=324767 RepID=UPI00200642EA|nr:hypothetical protein [Bacillus infantis]MCK6207716.1 hypothetical protein [Bacillus infantis]
MDKHNNEFNEEQENKNQNKIKISFGKFKFDMSGDFIKENGKIFAYGAVGCGMIVATGLTYCAVYTVTRNPQVATNVARNVLKLDPKLA